MESAKGNEQLLNQKLQEIEKFSIYQFTTELKYLLFSKAIMTYEYGEEFVNNPENALTIATYAQTLMFSKNFPSITTKLQLIVEELGKIKNKL